MNTDHTDEGHDLVALIDRYCQVDGSHEASLAHADEVAARHDLWIAQRDEIRALPETA